MAEKIAMLATCQLFLRGDYKKGETVMMTAEEAENHERLNLAVRKGVVASKAEEAAAGSPLEVLKGMWTYEVSAKDYLDKFPEGPDASLALQILEAEAEAVESVAAEQPLISTQSLPQE